MKNPEMTQAQRASQIWSVLAWAARNSQTITYSELAQLTGLPRNGMGNELELIARYCEEKRFPFLNTIVVNQDGKCGSMVALPKGQTEGSARKKALAYGEKWLKRPAPPQPSDFGRL